MADMRGESSEVGGHYPRTPWYRNSNWLLLLAVIVVGAWMYHIFTQGRTPARSAAVRSKSAPATAAPVARVYPTPSAPATIVQFAHASGDRGTTKPTDLTVALPGDPKAGDLLLAIGSSGFGCVPSPGWKPVGNDAQGSTTMAYHIVRPGDGKALVPFTTPRANSFTLEVVEISGDPEILGSPQAGGMYIRSSTVTNALSLKIPQTGGLLLQVDAASGSSSGNGPPIAARNTLPPGQAQRLVDRVPAYGWGSELVVRAVTTEPHAAPQPFKVVEETTFKGRKLPGNIVVGKLIWIGGIPAGGTPSNS